MRENYGVRYILYEWNAFVIGTLIWIQACMHPSKQNIHVYTPYCNYSVLRTPYKPTCIHTPIQYKPRYELTTGYNIYAAPSSILYVVHAVPNGLNVANDRPQPARIHRSFRPFSPSYGPIVCCENRFSWNCVVLYMYIQYSLTLQVWSTYIYCI